MKIEFSSLHQINHVTKFWKKIEVSNSGDLIPQYIERLLEEIAKSGSGRNFYFESNSTEVRVALGEYLKNSNTNISSEIILKRLMKVESDSQEEYKHLDMEIPSGSIFQTVLDENGKKRIILSKADHNEFIDDQEFDLRTGLPWKKRIFKAAMIDFLENGTVDSVAVYDTSGRISRYWWKDFLELSEIYTDEHNTARSLDMLDRKIFGSKMKADYPADQFSLRNSTIGYFQSNPEFDLDDYLEKIWSKYEPSDSKFETKKWIDKVRELPTKWNFDPKFSIIRSEVNKRKSTKIPLSVGIDLLIKEHLENVGDNIQAWKDDEGKKFVKIRSDFGYEKFNK